MRGIGVPAHIPTLRSMQRRHDDMLSVKTRVTKRRCQEGWELVLHALADAQAGKGAGEDQVPVWTCKVTQTDRHLGECSFGCLA